MLLTEPQAAAVLAITVRQLRTLRKQKLIPFVKLGRFPRFNPRALEAAVNKLTVAAKGGRA